MKKLFAVLLSLNLCVLTARFVQEMRPDAHAVAIPLPSSGDTNGDAVIDISDVIYLLNWLFQDGNAPVACAAPPDIPAAVLTRKEVLRLQALLEAVVVEPGGNITIQADASMTLRANGVLGLDAGDRLELQGAEEANLKSGGDVTVFGGGGVGRMDLTSSGVDVVGTVIRLN